MAKQEPFLADEFERLLEKPKFRRLAHILLTRGYTVEKLSVTQEPFSMVHLRTAMHNFYGFAKCHAPDTFDTAVGNSIALSRAMERAQEALA